MKEVGSPPHTRDKSCVEFCSVMSPGITPAYAGQIQKEHFLQI